MTERIRAREALSSALAGDPTPDAVVFEAEPVSDDWEEVRAELLAMYDSSRVAAIESLPAVFVVSSDSLLGRTGPGNAMVATGTLSAARSLAAETKKAGIPVNVLGVAEHTPVDAMAAWIRTLATAGAEGPTGELIQLGGTQIGKALP